MTVEDRGSAIRVECLTAIPVGVKGYVKVETNMGVVGWGEINNVETKVACALAESLGLARRRRKPDAHRAPLAAAVPRPSQPARRRADDARDCGH